MQADVRIDPNEEIGFMNPGRNRLQQPCRRENRIRRLEVEGYVVLPDILDAEHMDRIKREMADAPMQTKDYSDAQTFCLEPQWRSRALAELIAHPPMIEFLETLLGERHRVHPGALHQDALGLPAHFVAHRRPAVRVVHLRLRRKLSATAARSVLPRRPDTRAGAVSPGTTIPPVVPRGSEPLRALQIPPGRGHTLREERVRRWLSPSTCSTAPIRTGRANQRTLVQLGYRPAWAGPIQPMPEWDPELVAGAPAETRRFLQSPNTTGLDWNQPHKPKGMKSDAAAIDPGTVETLTRTQMTSRNSETEKARSHSIGRAFLIASCGWLAGYLLFGRIQTSRKKLCRASVNPPITRGFIQGLGSWNRTVT